MKSLLFINQALIERTPGVDSVLFAKVICKLIPSACPFAKTFQLGNLKLTIPPLCKLNPVYDFFVDLRFKALIRLEN